MGREKQELSREVVMSLAKIIGPNSAAAMAIEAGSILEDRRLHRCRALFRGHVDEI